VFVRKQQLWVITHHGHITSSALIAPDGILMKTYLTPKQMWTDTRQHNKALKISTESFFLTEISLIYWQHSADYFIIS